MPPAYKNYTLQECDKTLQGFLKEILSGQITFWQKFTCEQCWARIKVETPNKLFEIGHCQECGAYTDLKKTGCNYLLHAKTKLEKTDER